VDLRRERVRPPPNLGGAEGDFLRLEVRDEGAGIAAGNLPHVFDPFFTTKTVGEGTGLGLSVAWGIARDHGGWIDVSSSPGEGSRFAFHLPLADSPGAPLLAAVEGPPPHPPGDHP
jgi:signal transduction histidine kinase